MKKWGVETIAKAYNTFSIQCKIHVSILQTLTGDMTHVMHCLLFSFRAHSIALFEIKAGHHTASFLVPASSRHYPVRVDAARVVKSPALIVFSQRGSPFNRSQADLLLPCRQMRMPTAALPSSGEIR